MNKPYQFTGANRKPIHFRKEEGAWVMYSVVGKTTFVERQFARQFLKRLNKEIK